MEDLDSIFEGQDEGNPTEVITGSAPPEPPPTGEEAGEPPAEETPPQETETGEPSAEPAPEPQVDALEAARKEAEGLKQAMLAERQKRQQYEQFLAQQQQEKPKPEELPDFWEDPQAHLMRLQSEFQQELARRDQASADRLANISVAAARGRHEDFDEVMPVWHALRERNPSYFDRAMQAEDPGEFAYQVAKQAKAMQEMGDPATYKANIEKQLRAELEAEYKAKVEADAKAAFEAKLKEKLPSAMSGTRAAGGNQTPAWSGPPSAEQLYD